ncbi:hypothetical protein [Streptomyces antibioticus]|uniref:hypothetical protein n=1 Tax=Streptomyces antibioticus TaxID=1890 RepID=UPI0033DD75CC
MADPVIVTVHYIPPGAPGADSLHLELHAEPGARLTLQLGAHGPPASTDAEAADAEAERLRAAEARRRIAVMEAEAATADSWAKLNPREIKARRVARLIVAAGGNAKNIDVVSLKDIETAVGAARTTAGELRQEAAELLAGGYDPMTAYAPQSWH